jgi:periplasmic protein TonB
MSSYNKKQEKAVQESYLDIVFRNRNKMYGAYQLRKDYDAHVKKGLFFCCAIATIISLASFVNPDERAHKTDGADKPVKPRLIPVVLHPIPKPTQPHATGPKVPEQGPPKIVEHNKDIEKPTLDPRAIPNDGDGSNNEPTHGPDLSGPPAPPQPPTPPAPPSPPTPPDPPTPPTPIVELIDEEPEFPGGYKALHKYLQDQLEDPTANGGADYPSGGNSDGDVTGSVLVEFTIDESGKLSNVLVLKSLGKAYNAEAVRVIRTMPKWKPAKSKGKPVKSNFSITVTFQTTVDEPQP